LAGNPSDGYGGAVLSTTFFNFRAEVEAHAQQGRTEPPSELLDAALRRFVREVEPAAENARLRWRTSIPRAVGLGGSSALVIAALRALSDLHRSQLALDRVAALALAVEREDLGIIGGRQDQLVQSQERPMLMDFARERIDPLEPALLPPLLVAFRPRTAQDSGLALAPLRARFDRGERAATDAIDELATAAREAYEALRRRDVARFAACVDETFDVRARVLPLEPEHVAMIEHARACGAAANYTGSGGAIICVCREPEAMERLAVGLRELGCETLVPALGSSRDGAAGH
jgi:glucuronokinase